MPVGVPRGGERTAHEHDASLAGPPARDPPSFREVPRKAAGDPLFRARFGERFPWELSGGMQQRASLCRALIHEPALLMLDEPFAALDAFTREELWCVLRDLWERIGFTVILVTHDLREAAFLADTVHVMSARPGRIVTSRRVELPRPRDLEVCFEPPFVELVHELRGRIAEMRAA